ncbi:MAG TPA: SWIM zinc finger family protein [Allosphingosinicella sp.]|nr:SWIM zinc finger family protein [Allosphingosinicella sp.]
MEDRIRLASKPAATPAPSVSPFRIRLASSGEAERLPFLEARLAYPRVTAKALRAVSDMAAARFYVPPAMLARILREADPVATVSAEAVRFEGFSACCSAYARLDLDDEALAHVDQRSSGTTNVDFGKEMKQALARAGPQADMTLRIGSEGVAIRHEGGGAAEARVPLPLRWIKGFAEVQHHLAAMEHRFSLSRIGALHFLRRLPRSKDDRRRWVGGAGGLARIAASPSSGAVPLKGAHRLAPLEPLCVFAAGMDVFHNEALGSSAWVLNLPGQRLAIVLNAEPWRGFSGDGGILSALAGGSARHDALLRARLNWQTRLDEPVLAEASGLRREEIRSGLARLAAAGLLGYDLARRSWFHRVLPFDLSRLEPLNPRLRAATRLVENSAVTIGADGRSAQVAGADAVHKVSVNADGHRCTCPWFARNGNMRGPCKHVLAVELTLHGAGND